MLSSIPGLAGLVADRGAGRPAFPGAARRGVGCGRAIVRRWLRQGGDRDGTLQPGAHPGVRAGGVAPAGSAGADVARLAYFESRLISGPKGGGGWIITRWRRSC